MSNPDREAFEKWYAGNFYFSCSLEELFKRVEHPSVYKHVYFHFAVDRAWIIWQAAVQYGVDEVCRKVLEAAQAAQEVGKGGDE